MTGSYPITFVCCVESGVLEAQTLRMIESLRRWGGRFANAPVFAVTPRFGYPLSRKTHQAFERLSVDYLRFRTKSRYSWYNLLNKPYALVAAEVHSTSECIGWLDSDLLIIDEPDQLILNEGENFIACPVGKTIATTGPEDPQEPFWKEACQAVGIDIEELPWITTEREKERIRLYWNSGVFVYRRSTAFGNSYLQACNQLLDAHIINNQQKNIFFHEQNCLGLTMIKQELSWRSLPLSHNYGWGSKSYFKWHDEEQLKAAKIFHYHDAMYPHFWSTFIKCLRETHPPVADWLASLGPLKNEAPLQWRVTNKILKQVRSRQESAYIKSCRVI